MTPSTVPPAIAPAELVWQGGLPQSKQFGDITFSGENSLNEVRCRFINQNDLPARFAAISESGSFVVASNGFGTGLHFLAAWQAWQSKGPAHAATLHFISAEPHPLTLKDLEKALSAWPELQDFSRELVTNYPPLVRGAHRLVLAGGRVRLTLFFGEASNAWDELDFQADAWFLSRPAHEMNSEIWQNTAIERIRQHCRPGTTLTTSATDKAILRTLKEAGLQIQEPDDSGCNETILNGVFQPLSLPPGKSDISASPPISVAVIGAGIAGCLLANNLAQRGCTVTLIDSASQAGSAASGNLQGAMYVKLGVEFNHQTQLALSALTFSQRYYRPYRDQHWHPTGLLQLAWNENEKDRQRRFIERNQYPEEILRAVTRLEGETLTGSNLESGGLWFPSSGWLAPGELCKSLALHPRIRRVFDFSVEHMAAADGEWVLSGTGNTEIRTDRVVICAGHLSPRLIPGRGALRFKAIRGQVTHMPAAMVVNPKAVICGARYFNPAQDTEDGQLSVIGATFDLHSDEPAPTTQGHLENIRELSAMVPQILSPELASGSLPDQLAGRVGFRCTTHDYQPVAGPFVDENGHTPAGIYLLTGLGSKGLTYAPLLAEFVADQLTNQPSALPAALIKRVATGRIHRPKVESS